MKIAVIVRTYRRKNNTTKKNLLNMFKYLENQTYKNFKLFLIGDTYDNEYEFMNLCNSYKGDIFFFNSMTNYRGNYFKIKHNKWTCGGNHASFIGIKQALSENYEYYLHLDDDDIWKPNHIQSVVDLINKYPNMDFSFNCSKYINTFLPREYKNYDKITNKLNVKECNIVHSSWCINLKTLGKDLLNIYTNRINEIKQKKENNNEIRFYPMDATILKYLSNLQKNNKIQCYYNPLVTVVKLSDINIPQ